MKNVNKAILLGRLGKDPEIFTFESGIKKASFTLATNESFKTKDGVKSERTEWHNITLYREQADIAEKYLSKGMLIYLEGRIRNRSWESNGTKHYTTEIEVQNLSLLSKKEEYSGSVSKGAEPSFCPPPPPANLPFDPIEDELPF